MKEFVVDCKMYQKFVKPITTLSKFNKHI